ncbi:hypothetical protein [Abyssibacter profundi]|uniref:Uncharacterized protein n=1 Tax=Abyssibacter profundi TaxID=2182787 RepID=A0A363UMH4_9GAMM|nr:hypothetical protein [Abyssibacter profundi]PWN56613.1 hypothetical protein DEH80_07300 [Abyssibacter profundi]
MSRPSPAAPDWWTRDKRWRHHAIRSEAGSNHWLLLGMAAVVFALALPGTLAIPEELRGGNWPILAVLLFDALGAGLGLLALREWLAWRRFGEVEAVLDPWPGAIGGDVAGYFKLRRPLAADHRIRVELTCESRRRGHKKTITRPVWSHALDLQAMQRGEQQLWFHFKVPEELPASEPAGRDYHVWRLTLDVSQPGADLKRQYAIPVLPGPARNRTAEQATRIDTQPLQAALSRLMNIYRSGDRVTLDFRPGRNWVLALPLLLFGLCSIASGGFLATQAGVGSVFELVPGLMAGVFLLVGTGMLLGGLWTLGHRRIVLIDADQVATRVFCFGWPITTRHLPREAVRHLGWQRTGTTQSGRQTAVWHALAVHHRLGKPLRIGDGFKSRQAVEAAAAQLGQLTGLPVAADA